MDAASEDSPLVNPFGFARLCLGLIGIIVFGLLVTVGIGAIAAAVAALVMGWQAFIGAMNDARGAGDKAALIGLSLMLYFGIAAGVFLAAKWQGKSKWRDLIGWRPFRLFDGRIWAIMIAALVYSMIANGALEHFFPHPPAQLTIPSDPGAAAALFVLAVVFAPVTEELVFRGWLYTGLRFNWGVWPALLTTSVLFAAAHYEKTHLYTLAVFPVGLALCAIRECTGSVKASIFFHAINNFAAFGVAMLVRG
jgi:membrane protease YdiL (CAAX protease family)